VAGTTASPHGAAGAGHPGGRSSIGQNIGLSLLTKLVRVPVGRGAGRRAEGYLGSDGSGFESQRPPPCMGEAGESAIRPYDVDDFSQPTVMVRTSHRCAHAAPCSWRRSSVGEQRTIVREGDSTSLLGSSPAPVKGGVGRRAEGYLYSAGPGSTPGASPGDRVLVRFLARARGCEGWAGG
jgi:hypothetical protein